MWYARNCTFLGIWITILQRLKRSKYIHLKICSSYWEIGNSFAIRLSNYTQSLVLIIPIFLHFTAFFHGACLIGTRTYTWGYEKRRACWICLYTYELLGTFAKVVWHVRVYCLLHMNRIWLTALVILLAGWLVSKLQPSIAIVEAICRPLRRDKRCCHRNTEKDSW